MSTAQTLPEPVAYGLMPSNGVIHFELIGTKEDCEYWTRAEREEQSGWPIAALYTDEQLHAALAEQAREIEALRNERDSWKAEAEMRWLDIPKRAKEIQEREALRADAERYRWLRASETWPLTLIGPADVLDAKIDAAKKPAA